MNILNALFKKKKTTKEKPYHGEIEEAKKNPNGYVYRIEGNYSPEDRIPPEAIIGVWKVNSEGIILGDFQKNPNHKPIKDERTSQSTQWR